jgi:hypothetical protein
MMHLVCYLRQGSKVYETWWTTIRGVEVMDNSYHLLDLTAYGRQEDWEDSPEGWPRAGNFMRTYGPDTLSNDRKMGHSDGRPIPQWDRLKAGHSDDLGTGKP